MKRPNDVLPSVAALTQVETPRIIHTVARRLGWILLGICLLLALAPWVQTVAGAGQVVADAPLERTQAIESPIKGRVLAWHVREGQAVATGDLLATIGDNDPAYLERLRQNQAAAEQALASARTEVEALQAEHVARAIARARAIEAAEARITEADQKVIAQRRGVEAARASDKAARLDLTRRTTLEEKGVRSRRDLESATLRRAKSRTELAKARADLAAAQATVFAKKADLAEKAADADAKLAKIDASVAKAQATVAKAGADLAKTSVDVARQERGEIRAPRDGVILRLQVQADTEQVKAGDPVAMLVPTASQAAVELWLDGNDAPLVEPGSPVRLQFEGWPAFQFSGWPGAAIGTFGGRVAYVDATNGKDGKFRVLVRPDADDSAWPSADRLRQGGRVNGWVQLNEVRLGFEVWRQLNGFPPMPTPMPAGEESSSKEKVK
ncbi:MAG: adhesin transport system membrane fusion protein [Bradymonadia bacterium]|jgi:adhesin transport system membrane fusion protein